MDRVTVAPPNHPDTMLGMKFCSTYTVTAVPIVATPSGLHIHVYASTDVLPYMHR